MPASLQRLGWLGLFVLEGPSKPSGMRAERCAACGPSVTVRKGQGWCRRRIHEADVTPDDGCLDLALRGKGVCSNFRRRIQDCGLI